MTTIKSCLLCYNDAPHYPVNNYPQDWVKCDVCGLYKSSWMLIEGGLNQDQKPRAYLLSALTRAASDAGNPMLLTAENLELVLGSSTELSPLEKMDRTLIVVSQAIDRPDEGTELLVDTDYPLVRARDGGEFNYYIDLLIERGLLDTPNDTLGRRGAVRLTPEGWTKVNELRSSLIDSNQAFVAMWFADEMVEAWEGGFKPALSSTGFNPYRVDKDPHNDKIDDRIIAEIRRSSILIADFTGHRGGVYFEAGFAMGLGIPVVWTCRASDIEEAHFDTRQYNHVVWNDPEELKSMLADRIAATLPGRHIQE